MNTGWAIAINISPHVGGNTVLGHRASTADTYTGSASTRNRHRTRQDQRFDRLVGFGSDGQCANGINTGILDIRLDGCSVLRQADQFPQAAVAIILNGQVIDIGVSRVFK